MQRVEARFFQKKGFSGEGVCAKIVVSATKNKLPPPKI